jgi:hypothetical protein
MLLKAASSFVAIPDDGHFGRTVLHRSKQTEWLYLAEPFFSPVEVRGNYVLSNL